MVSVYKHVGFFSLICDSEVRNGNEIYIRYVSLLLVHLGNFKKSKSKLLTCKFVIVVI